LLIVLFYFVLSCFSVPLSCILFFLGLCVGLTFWQCFLFIQKSCIISISFFPINTMSSAYANTFSCSLSIYIPLGTIFILCITFCNAKLNNVHVRKSPCFSPVLFSKKDDSVPSILTALFVFCTHVLNVFINFLGILNSSLHFHIMSLCIESYAF